MSADDLTPRAHRVLDFLLADFDAQKAEIARRSGLQRVAVALYLALVAAVATSLPEGKNLLLSVAALWLGALIALLFWSREHLEIMRLACLIRDHIAERASAILDVTKEHIMPSEAVASIDAGTESTSRRYHLIFMWLVFFVVPILVTLYVVCHRPTELLDLQAGDTPTPYLALLAFLFIAGNLWRLLRRCSNV